MSEHEHEPGRDVQHRRGGVPTDWVLIGFFVVAGYFLFTEHRAHVLPYLPYALVLACPLMHFFHGHGKHGRHGEQNCGEPPKDKGGRE